VEARTSQNRRNAALAARTTNARILAMAESLKWGTREQAVAFFCECGCLDVIPMTPSRYRSLGGAWLPNHKPQ
jgi:hypothetical protein